jgi:hypothetical protein
MIYVQRAALIILQMIAAIQECEGKPLQLRRNLPCCCPPTLSALT